MYALGIDIGTTNLNASLVDLCRGRIVERRSAPNRRMPSEDAYAYEQDPTGIVATVREMIASIPQPVASICVTGQVHGILYVDGAGRPLSPLYNWLDRRGMEPVDGTTPRQRLLERTGQAMPVGYGLLAHYANRMLGKVPAEAAAIVGINEFVTGSLIGRMPEKTDASNLGPFGAFDPVTGAHDRRVLEEILPPGSPAFLGLAEPFEVAGRYSSDGAAGARAVPVAHSVGDNQAGFFGLVSRPEKTGLVSIGTSGQISIFSRSAVCAAAMELRPFLGLGYLHVGATLCAGKTYEVLERFLRGVLEAAGSGPSDDEAVFRLMAAAASAAASPSPLFVDAAINGTRADSSRRGSVAGIAIDNFTLGNLVRGTVEGIVRELVDFRAGMEEAFSGLDSIVAAGSAVRKNPLFREALAAQFGLDVRVPDIDGGAALGAALVGAAAAGLVKRESVADIVDALWEHERSDA
jgi:sedoheptulokinase